MVKSSETNPNVDISNVPVSAFTEILTVQKKGNVKYLLAPDVIYQNHKYKSPNFKAKIRAWTKDDNKSHTYFHSLSIDVNVDDFMGTAELKCPYDSKLMEYWEPIRQTVVIYGTNRGKEKILFIGRVRGVKQDGYELVVEFQNYAWKFKQLVTQSYAKDNVLKKDGYTIMRLMFEALKIDSYVISESAKRRLKEVGINEDGNLTVNGEEVKKIPDLLERLQKSDPSKLLNKNTINDKLKEQYLHNINHINYTLKYEKPTPVMKKIQSQGSYTGGSNIYDNAYASPTAVGGGSAQSTEKQVRAANGGCDPRGVIEKACPQIQNQTMVTYMRSIWKYQRNCAHDIYHADKNVVDYAQQHPTFYISQIQPCLATLAKYTERSGGKQTANGASYVRSRADAAYSKGKASGMGGSKSKSSNKSKSKSSSSINIFGWKPFG